MEYYEANLMDLQSDRCSVGVMIMNGNVPSATEAQGLKSQKAYSRHQEVFPNNIERMFETFHQSATKDFKATFYNPFEVKHRRRTTKAQFRVLESAFKDNNKPNASARRVLAAQLGMTPRAVQVWFQNRRAKNKSFKGGGSMDEADSCASPLLAIEDDEVLLRSGKATKTMLPRGRVSSANANAEPAGPNLGRRHSMPEMQQPILKDGSLPFRELHEAIFGKTHSRSITSSMMEPFPAENGMSQPMLSAIPISRPSAQPRKNSGCSTNFLNSFLNLGISPSLEHYGISPNAAVSYDPMISGDLEAGGQLLNATTGHSVSHPELAAPSISAPGSSPNMASEDLFQLQKCLRSGQPPNAAAVEAMALRLTTSLSAAELDILMHNVNSHKKDPAFDFFNGTSSANNSDLTGLLFPSNSDANNLVNPLELLSCIPSPSDHFLFPNAYPEDTMDSQFS